MDLPQKPDGGLVFEKTLPQIAPSLSRLPKRLAQKNEEYLAAEYSFSDSDFFRHDSGYATVGNGTYVFTYFDGHPGSIFDFPAPGFLPVFMPGGWLFGDLFHGLGNGAAGCRSEYL